MRAKPSTSYALGACLLTNRMSTMTSPEEHLQQPHVEIIFIRQDSYRQKRSYFGRNTYSVLLLRMSL